MFLRMFFLEREGGQWRKAVGEKQPKFHEWDNVSGTQPTAYALNDKCKVKHFQKNVTFYQAESLCMKFPEFKMPNLAMQA